MNISHKLNISAKHQILNKQSKSKVKSQKGHKPGLNK